MPGLEINDRGEVVKFDFEAQVHSVFANVKTVLDASGSSWDELVDVTVFLVNMERILKPLTASMPNISWRFKSRPCRTTVEINCLPTPIAIELKCIATVKNN